jgi:hypothetical protein
MLGHVPRRWISMAEQLPEKVERWTSKRRSALRPWLGAQSTQEETGVRISVAAMAILVGIAIPILLRSQIIRDRSEAE